MRIHNSVWRVTVLLYACLTTSAFDFPPAQNISWKSTNFKTLLLWGPEPTSDYSYTVEFSQVGKDRERNSHCIQTSSTQCDLTSSLTDLRACYTADILSQPPQGEPAALREYPSSSSPRFCPYVHTVLLPPDFKVEVSTDQRLTTVQVTADPLTAIFRDQKQLSLRDVFGDELEYKVTYWRNKSTGKKVEAFKSNTLELSSLDPGESYCFQVQVLVNSRPSGLQLGELSQTQCTHQRDPSLLDQFSVGVIAGAVLFLLLVVGGLTAGLIICCTRRKKSEQRTEKEIHALNV